MSQQNSSSSTGSQTVSESPRRSLGEMNFFEHVEELRARLMRCLMVFMVGFVCFYFVAEPILSVLRAPLFEHLPPEQQKLYFTSLFEGFMVHLKIAGYASVFFLSPYFFYELWGFLSPGLYPKERKLFIPFVSAATFFFLGGAAFAYFVLFPVGFKYFITYGGPHDVPLLTMASYYDTCLKLLLLFGLSFELPVLIVLLGYLGLVDAPLLRAHRRTAVLIITVLSALFAPPDAMSMIILGVPLYLMYEGAIWVVQWLGVRRAPESAQNTEPPYNPFDGQSRP